MQSERTAIERTIRRQEQQTKEPIEILKQSIREINDELNEHFSKETLKEEYEDFIDNYLSETQIVNLNPTAFFFGLIAIDIKKNIKGTKTYEINLNNIRDNDATGKKKADLELYNSIMKEKDISIIDIVRYSRFWIKLKKEFLEGGKEEEEENDEEERNDKEEKEKKDIKNKMEEFIEDHPLKTFDDAKKELNIINDVEYYRNYFDFLRKNQFHDNNTGGYDNEEENEEEYLNEEEENEEDNEFNDEYEE